MNKLLILDRDGVINFDSPDYIKSPEEWRPIPGSLEAIAKAAANDWTVAVATNQSAIGRGMIDEDILGAIHDRMLSEVEAIGGRVDIICWCPHLPEDDCECRKPRTGLLTRISAELGLPLEGAVMVGDSGKDLEAARAAGLRAVLVRTGNGAETEKEHGELAEFIADDLADAIDQLITKS